ncbi:MAG: hypothetical protein CBB93_009110 [Oceanospirillales bacterium TMED33]|nr:hypothetical protein [Gammaproteobacteria bacterium]RPG19192.1 MAG: hypothetical protein CBB93_009110 [Oceanospirillales bacterium TMED33]|tara:strand:+ start:500 stop:796 length:297 start_codon:yes stop_codon:yes gene_type:complete
MEKEHFFTGFSALSEKIDTAIAMHNFELVEKYDRDRRNLILKAKEEIVPDGNTEFLNALLKCSHDNLDAISHLQSEIRSMSRSQVNALKAMEKYKRSS